MNFAVNISGMGKTLVIRDDMTNAEYHAHPAISSSDVKAVLLSTVWHWVNQVRTETSAMALGTAVHDMTLEGGLNTVRGPETRRGNAWKEAEEQAKSEGKEILTSKDYDLAEDIAEALMAEPACAKQLTSEGAKKEYSLFATCPKTGLELRCRPDLYNPTDCVMSDVKTTTDASPMGFNKVIYKFRYDVQAAFYKYVAELCGWRVAHFAFLAVENKAPHAAHMHVMSMEALEIGHKDMMRTLEEIAEAKKEDNFALNWGRFTMVHPPAWITTE